MTYLFITFMFIANSLFSQQYKSEYKYELSICSIFQDDSKYLPEWIEFHESQGVEHFFLYNNLSSDDYIKNLSPYIKRGIVELIEWPYEQKNIYQWNGIQCSAYMDCINKHKNDCRWIAFLDTDEFLFSPEGRNLKRVLKEYLSYAAVGVNWVMYGTSNVERLEPGQKMLDYLVWRAPMDHPNHLHIKTIVRPKYVVHCENPHYFLYIAPSFAVTENKEYIPGPFSKYTSVERLRINHYWQRDIEFFWSVKAERRKKWSHIKDEDMRPYETLFNDEFDDILSNK